MKIPINNHEIDTTINRCLPGKYKLILIADLDENGYWTKGDIVDRRLPEPIFDYNSEIELKKIGPTVLPGILKMKIKTICIF